MDKWDACAFKVNPDDLKGRVCYGGLDLSSSTDITAFVLVFPQKMRMINTVSFHTFGYQKKILISELEGIMLIMIYGKSKVLLKPLMVMSFTMVS